MGGEKSDLVPPLCVRVQERLGRPESLAGVGCICHNSVDNCVLLQILCLMFVNFSIFVSEKVTIDL